MKKIIKIAVFVLYFFLLFFVFSKLFLEEQFDRTVSRLTEPFRTTVGRSLAIGYADPLLSLSPLINDSGSRSRLLHIYEALVSVTPDLQIEPALALSYGILDDLTWEFRLRPDVRFHDGRSFGMADVVASFESAKKEESGVSDLAAFIEAVEPVDDRIFHIRTQRPDPLLLQKLSYLFIFPADGFSAEHPVGTGPYEFQAAKGGELTLKRFEQYWGRAPVFDSVTLKTFASKDAKIAALKDRSVDILGNVPAELGENFNFSGFDLSPLPSLEVDFLMFHFEKTFRSRELREAVSLALNPRELFVLTFGFAKPANQFVRSGIFGFDPSIPEKRYDPKRAEELVKSVSGLSRVATTLDLPRGTDIFGKRVTEQLKRVGIDVTVRYLEPTELSDLIRRQASEFYFFGWRSDLGDSGDFLSAVMHSKSGRFGQFNGGNYRNSQVDRDIELSREVVNQQRRLEYLRRAMRAVTTEDIAGVPLFTPEILYAVSKRVQFQPRVDGHILAQEVAL